jgi:hypothetical protein
VRARGFSLKAGSLARRREVVTRLGSVFVEAVIPPPCPPCSVLHFEPLVRSPELNRNTRHWHTRRSVRCAHVSPVRRYFRAHSARYCIKAQVHECTNLLWSDLVCPLLTAASWSERLALALSHLPWHATSQDTEQLFPDKTVSGYCTSAHLPAPPVHRTSVCCATSSQGSEPSLSLVFLASQYRRRLPTDPTSR